MADKIDAKTNEEIQRLGDVFREREKQMLDSEAELKDFVWKVMDEQHLWDSTEDILDMIYRIPKSYVSFMLWERYHELKKQADK